jgi:hypothetical protein
MLVFEFIGTDNNKGWIDFMMKEVIEKNNLLELFDKTRPKIIKSASRILESDILEGEAVQYELEYDPNSQKERRHGRPLVKIYTTMPGGLVDDLRSRIKAGLDIDDAVKNSAFPFPKIAGSQKKMSELTALARIFSKKADGFDFLIIKC